MINILLLSAGTNACYHTAKTLKEKFPDDFYIIGADINEQHLISSCNYLDKFYKVPVSTDKSYYNIILSICKEEKVNYILPSFDTDQFLFYPENDDLIKLGVKSLSTCYETLEIYKDKDNMNSFLKENGFLIPIIYSKNDIKGDKNYFVKPQKGAGSIGAKELSGEEILSMKNIDDYIIQEVCTNPEYTMECFLYEGELRTAIRERVASKSGVCTKTKFSDVPEFRSVAKSFIEKLKCPYFFNIQFMKNSVGEFVITDINLRLAGGMGLSAAAGWDEISALAKIMLGKNKAEVFETLPEKIKPQCIVRAYTDIVTKIDRNTIAFDFDGTLLDSRERHKIVLSDILKKYKINLDTSDLVEFKRQGKNNVDYLLSKGLSSEDANNIQKEWIENIEKEEYLKHDKLYPEAVDLLEKYSEKNDLILITARNNKEGLHNQIKKFNLEKYFTNIYVVNSGKLTISEKAKILKKESVSEFFGDTQSDEDAACEANVRFTHVDRGFHSKEIIGHRKMIHSLSDVQSKNIGRGTSIWQYCVVLPGAKIGNDCNICSNCFIENDVVIGDNVTIKNGVFLYDGLRVEDNVFIGANVTLCNDRYPKSKNKNFKLEPVVIKKGASIGANATILPGVTIGENALIAAGAIVTKDVEANTVYKGKNNG